MIEINNLTHKYGDKVAVDNLSLKINDGEIFGLIGHNGAGKTTTIKSLVSILYPTEGEIIINGMNLNEHRLEVKKITGYVADSPDLFLKLPAYTYWMLMAKAYGVSDEDFNYRLDNLTKTFDMQDHYFETIESFSHGMRQKTFVIGALISEPKIWILDEPLTGLDPQSSFNLKQMMRDHAAKGNAVLFSTHVLEVAEQLCNRIGILKKGKLIFIGTMEELKAAHPDRSLEDIYLEMVNENNEVSEDE